MLRGAIWLINWGNLSQIAPYHIDGTHLPLGPLWDFGTFGLVLTHLVVKLDVHSTGIGGEQMHRADAADWLSLSDGDPPTGNLSILIGRQLWEMTLAPLMVLVDQVQGFPCSQHSDRGQRVI